MTIADLIYNFRLQGHTIIKRWHDDTNDYEILYDSDIEYDKPEEDLLEEYEIKYMYPILIKEIISNIDVAAMVIEVE